METTVLVGTARAYRYEIEMDLFLHLLAKEAREDPIRRCIDANL